MALPTYSSSIITAVSRAQQNVPFPQYVIGGQNAGTYKLFKKGTTYDFTVWRSKVYQIGKNFDVLQIKFSLVPVISAGMVIVPVLYFDNESSISVGTEINATNYPNSEKFIKLSSDTFAGAVHGRNNFFFELQFTGSSLAVVELPITIEIEEEE